jgi:2-succinyl-5-enolpyruvyl-6-hydroxy-3-cyclohexene-1-carboxylate synthase
LILQNIVNIAEICAQQGVEHLVLSPGSRCAPLTIAFVRHPKIQTKIVSDERAAAFIALGMAQRLARPVGICCTSGSAVYNYAPAVAEAFYQHIPLIIFTADRPPEWIDQLDGQTIRQQNIFGKHVKGSFQLPVDASKDDLWFSDRIISEAINLANTYPYGPVHINVPVREPFYPEADEEIQFDENIKVIEQLTPQYNLSEDNWKRLLADWQRFDKKLILGGQQAQDKQMDILLEEFSQEFKIPMLGDVISNLHGSKEVIRHQDIFLGKKDEALKESLQTDLLITFGRSVISKNLKLFLRKYKPKAHWHIQPAGQAADTFQALSQIIPMEAKTFLRELLNRQSAQESNVEFWQKWQQAESEAREFVPKFIQKQKEHNEFSAVEAIIRQLPESSDLHLANSMAVRYANFVSLEAMQSNVEVFANRGTSGIDGSNSTAVGNALATNRLTTLITGDMAFFYDRNAFWHNYLPENLRVIVLNNHAGGIFGMIEGPSRQPELGEYFETTQPLNAARTAKDFGLDYLYCDRIEQLQKKLQEFFRRDGQAKLLEIETDKTVNKSIFTDFKQQINNRYGK